ncbi:MAG: NAD(P)H-hydrate dehydratase, partial [Flavobacteriaceae bacterium]|nr:NAD(P)H-hydrate dehydratase [Flavobacteriaceae bacterium]
DKLLPEHKTQVFFIKQASDFPVIYDNDIVVDALFGIGIARPIEGWLKTLVEHINAHKAFVVSIDMPSGLYCDTMNSQTDAIIVSDHCFCFQSPALSFFNELGYKYAPSWEAIDIGLDRAFLYEQKTPILIGLAQAKAVYKARTRFSSKIDYGHLLSVSGSFGKIGASILAAKAALQSGVGMLTVHAPRCGYEILQSTCPEAVLQCDVDLEVISDVSISERINTLLIGPGIGLENKTKSAVKSLLPKASKVVLDADALNILAQEKCYELIPPKAIFTPHDGELKRLIGTWSDPFERIEKTRAFSCQYDCIMVLKGAFTQVVYKDELYINTSGNPGMATAGCGDVLSGIIAAFLAQGYAPQVAAFFSVYIHGLSADIIAETQGHESITAGKIIEHIGVALKRLG